MLNVLIVTPIYPPAVGGPSTFAKLIAEHIEKDVNSVKVVTYNRKQNIENESDNTIKVKYQSLLIRNFSMLISIYRNILKNDVILALGLFELVALANSLGSKRVIAKVVSIPFWEKNISIDKKHASIDFLFNTRKHPIRFLRLKIFKIAIEKFDTIICPSVELIDILKKIGIKNQIMFIPNGVEIPQIQQIKQVNDLIYIGRLIRLKNIDLIIQAAAYLKMNLIIVGEGPERENLEKIAKDSNANVDFYGYQSPENIQKLLHRTRFFILISEREGMSFALLEAMSAGKCIIASNNDGNQYLIKNNVNGFLINPNASELINILTFLEKNKQLVNEVQDRARKDCVELYSIGNISQKYLEILKNE